MKFKLGHSVEVLRRENGPCGSWFPATITSVDGSSSYTVKYQSFTERVCGEDVRPIPPREKGKRWMVGDLAEVFDVHCWRVGTVSKILRNGCFMVKLFGSIQLKEFHKSDMRVRQTWHNDKWSVIEKSGQARKIANSFSQYWGFVVQAPVEPTNEESCSRDSAQKHLTNTNHRNDHGKTCLPGRTTKGHSCFPEQPSKNLVIRVNLKKRKLIQTEEQRSCPPRRTRPSSEQVDDFSIPQRSNMDSNQCSVASCSVNEFDDFPAHRSNQLLENVSDSSDAESSFASLCSKQKRVELSIHELELRAYNSTIQALYASGPLSWEQETLLTDLRFSLNISNEEHLLQLRHLLSIAV